MGDLSAVRIGLLSVVVGVLAIACGCKTRSQPSASANDASPAAASGAKGQVEPSKKETAAEAVFAAVRTQRYSLAAKRFDVWRPAIEKSNEPELRYLRARIAFELDDHPRVLRLLKRLEEELPLFDEEIQRYRVLSQARVGPYESAAEVLEKSQRLSDALLAVEALRKLEEYPRALALIAKRLKRVESSGKDEERLAGRAKLRRARADLLIDMGKGPQAVGDLRWLALHAPTTPSASQADELFEQLARRPLKKQERYARAEQFTDDGNVDAVKRELELMTQAPGKTPPGVEVLRTRAWAEYKARGDYLRASELFRQAAKLSKRHRQQDLFFSARALSRAHRDEEAIVRYLELAKRFPKSGYAEQARYLAARLHYILGQWAKAESAYNDYLKRYSKGKKRSRYEYAVRYERSVSQLALGRGEHAISDLKRLIRVEHSDRERANLRQLLGVAHLQNDSQERAQELFSRAMRDRPLSFAALVAAARLEGLDAPLPPMISSETSESSSAGAASNEKDDALKPLQVKLPPKVEMLVRLGLHLDAERALQKQAHRLRQRYSPHGGRALCIAYGRLSTAKLQYRHALRLIRERAIQREIEPDTRWAWECIYPRPYAEFVEAEESKHDIPSGLVFGVMRQESAFRPRVTSHAGAIGLMQLMPATARKAAQELGRELQLSELRSPPTNIALGAFYLGKLLRRFEGYVPLALAGYNAGPAAVDRWLDSAKDLPLDLFVARIPYGETRKYVRRVVGNWARYRYLEQGLGALPQLDLQLPQHVQATTNDY